MKTLLLVALVFSPLLAKAATPNAPKQTTLVVEVLRVVDGGLFVEIVQRKGAKVTKTGETVFLTPAGSATKGQRYQVTAREVGVRNLPTPEGSQTFKHYTVIVAEKW